MSDRLFDPQIPGVLAGLAGALEFYNNLAAAAANLPEDSGRTIVPPNMVGIVPPGTDLTQLTGPQIFDHAKDGTGTPGNDTEPKLIAAWCAYPGGGSAFVNVFDLYMAFTSADGGEAGVNAAQSVLNSQTPIPAVNS